MQYSYSRCETFQRCPFRYFLHYLKGVKTLPNTEADNALTLGTAVHTGIERGVAEGVRAYLDAFPVLTDEQVEEVIKLETVIPLARRAIPEGGAFEVEVRDADFLGFLDYLVPVGRGRFDLYDFKYSNNVENYLKSGQLHVYKYFFEKNNPSKKINRLYYVMIPKVRIRQRKGETVEAFRHRLREELARCAVQVVEVPFDYTKVAEFLLTVKHAKEEMDFPQQKSPLCQWCAFYEWCEKGWDYFMQLPENKRRNVEKVQKRVLWIYGAPFCGKTTFANAFPDPLMLNTDGNIKFVDAPFIRIRDEVKTEGRQTRRTLAWEVFKESISELEKKENSFKTIIVDLLEDLYEHCRLYMYQQMGITHESDDSFRAWDKVRGEFLNTLRRLMNLDYENIILISHEDTSKDITRKGGDKITSIKPNLADKVASKVAGMVDVVARIVADGDVRTFCFKSNEVIFGGGRLKVKATDIPLDVSALFAVYDEANNATQSAQDTRQGRETTQQEETQPSQQTQPERRERRTRV